MKFSNRKKGRILAGTVFIFFSFFIIFVILYSFTPVIDQTILKILNMSAGEGIQVDFDRIEGNLIGNIRLVDFKFKTSQVNGTAKSIDMNYSLLDLLEKKYHINSLVFNSPVIQMNLKSSPVNADTVEDERKLSEKLSSQVNLSPFFGLIIENLRIREGKLVVSSKNESKTFAKIFLESAWKIEENDVSVKLNYLRGKWLEKDIECQNLSFKLTGNEKRVTINQFMSKLNGAEIVAHGEVEFIPRLRFFIFADTSTVRMELVKKILPKFRYKTGYLKFHGNYLGNPSEFNGQLYFRAVLDSLNINRFSGQYRLKNKSIFLDQLTLSSNFGSVKGMAVVSPEGKNIVDLKYSNLNLKKVNILETPTQLTGALHLNFNSWQLHKLSGYGKALAENIHLGKSRIDTLLLELRAVNGNWELKKGSRLVVQKRSQFFLHGTLTREQNLQVELTTDNNNLDTLGSKLAIPGLGGAGSAEVKVTGPLKNPDIKGYLLLDSLALGRILAYGVEGNFNVKGLAKERIGGLKIEMLSGRVLNTLVTDGTLISTLLKNTATIDSLSFYNDENYIAMAGQVDYWPGLIDIKFPKLELKYKDYHILATDTIQCLFYGDTLDFQDFVLQATGNGEIEIRGLWAFKKRMELGIYLRNIQLEPFNQFLQVPYNYKGIAESSIELFGSIDSLEAETQFNVEHFVLDADTIGSIDAAIEYRGNKVEISDFSLQHSKNSFLKLNGELDLPKSSVDSSEFVFSDTDSLSLDFSFRDLQVADYPFFAKYNFPVKGKFSGGLHLFGSVTKVEGNYHLNAQNLEYEDYRFPGINITGNLLPDKIAIDSARIRFVNTDIFAAGAVDANLDFNHPFAGFTEKPIDFLVEIQEDTLDFLNLFQPEVDILTGKINLQARIQNTFQNLDISSGQFSIKNGTFYLSKIENPVTDLQLNAHIENKKLVIDKATGNLAGKLHKKNIFKRLTSLLMSPFSAFKSEKKSGSLSAEGVIDLSIWDRPQYDLTVNADRIYLNYFLENTQLVTSAKNLRITGRDTLLIQGALTVHQAEIDLDLKESKKNLLLYPSTREIPPYLYYMLSISIPGNFFVRSDATFNSFDMQLAGNIKLIQEPKSELEMYGSLDILKGKYVQFEEFNIQKGRIEFVNPKELPRMDLQAEKRDYGYIFELNVKGPINNPEKNIRIIDAVTLADKTYLYPDTKDQIAMLLFGVTFSELGKGTGSIMLKKGQEVVNQVLISQIEKEARHFVGLDQIRFESGESSLDFSNRRLNQASGTTSLALGKYLTPQLYFEYKTRLSSSGLPGVGSIPTPRLAWEAGNQIYLEYRLNRNWSISTFYEKRESDLVKFNLNWRYDF